MVVRWVFCSLVALGLFAAPQFHTARQIDVTLTEGTSMAAAVSPDQRWIAIDLLGALWVLPFEGGEARKITTDALEARQPTWAPDSRTIAFQGYDDGAWHIYAIGRDGGSLRRLTDGAFDDREPAWSHDGQRIAFSSDRRGGVSTIWTLTLPAGDVRQVTSDDSTMPSWAPGDREIVFISHKPPASGQGASTAIQAVDASGRTRDVVPSGNGPIAVSWSPDGSQLAQTDATGLAVWTDRRLERLTRPFGEDVFPFRAQWISPTDIVYTADGQIKRRSLRGATSTIPFTATVALQRPAYTIQPRSLEPRALQPLQGIVAPAVSRDGRSIAFVAMGDLWILPAGSNPVQVTNDAAVELDPTWAPDGSAIAFSSDRDGRMDLWRHDLRTNEASRLTDRGGVTGASWAPDGNHIAFLVEHRALSVVTLRRDGHEFPDEPPPAAGEIGRPTWSADSQAIAVGALFPFSNRYREGLNQILVRTAGLWTSSLLVAGGSAGNREHDGPVWSPDGFQMAFVTAGSLWSVSVDQRGAATAPPRLVAMDHPSSPSWEGDGEHIVYQTPQGLRRIGSGGGGGAPIGLNLQWSAAAPPARVVVHAGRVFDGVFDGLRHESDIVVENGIIREITAHHDDLHVGAVVDASKETVMPGLIDMHTHLDPGYGQNFGRLWLAYGITSIRVPAIEPYAAMEMVEAFDAGRRPGPRVFFSGDPFDGVRVFYPGGVSITSEEQLVDQLERAQALGVDFFKTYVRLPDRFQRTVIDYAHARGKPVTSHELYPAVAFGADGVEHLRGTSRRGYSPKASGSNRAYRDVIDLITKSGITLTPTIGIQGAFALRESGDKELLYDPRLALYPRSVVATLADLTERRPTAEMERALRPYEATVKAIAAGGGQLLAGTDSPIIPYGLSLHVELESYVRAGLTPLQAIRTATTNAAQALGLESELGTIEVGKRADLAFIAGDPLQSIRATRDVRRVMRSGRIYTLNDLVAAR